MSAVAIQVQVDPGELFARSMSDLEQQNLPYAVMQAVNRTAGEIQYQWERLLRTQLDRPVSMTLNAVKLRKARYSRGSDGTRITEAAEVFIRDEAAKGTPPAKYLAPQVFGGAGHAKGIDTGLVRAGFLRAGARAIPPQDGGMLDAHGNVRRGVVQQVLSQLGGQFDELANEPMELKRERNRKARGKSVRTARNRRYFAVSLYSDRFLNVPGARARTRHLSPGIYLRDGKHDLTKVFNFVRRQPQYTPRLDLFTVAADAYDRVFPYFFERELASAVRNAIARGWT